MASLEDATQRLGGAAGADEEDGTTRPIDPSALPPPPASTASSPQAGGQSGETSTPPAAASPRWFGDPTTQGLPEDFAPPPPPPGASTPTVSAPPPRRRRAFVALSALALVLILAIVALLGVLASANALPFFGASTSPTATPGVALTPTATTPPGFTVYRDLQSVYQICRPNTWSEQEHSEFGGTGVALVKPNSFVSMVIIQRPNPGVTTNQALLDAEFTSLAQQGSVSNRQRLTDDSVGGASWAQGSADWVPAQPGATKEHIVLLATLHGDRSVVIELVESPGDTASADAATFETMLSCFTFL